jgi:3-hydroxymyristoyl/3-hydroxydecanoyl-(acyl carrier protein) dehydratase
MNSGMLLSALSLLPHGAEFRFIDRLVRLEPGKSGAGEYLVRGDEVFLRGHFPGAPLFPGVLLIEAVAQLSGIVAQSDPARGALSDLKLTAIRGAKILGSACPGELVVLESSISGRLGNLVQARGSAVVNGKLVLQTELTLAGSQSGV